MEDDLINLPVNWEGAPIFYNDVFLAVVGRTGNGKSSVANSILGRPAFISNGTMNMVTCASKMKSTILKDGRHVHVIDTPGLIDISTDPEFVGREIVKCIDLARDGLHAVLVVFAMHHRFTRDEVDVIRYIKTFFGDRIVDYLIVVLTGGEVLEKSKKSLSEWIKDCPESLKNLILLCQARVAVFDNITKDEVKRERQVKRLISLIDYVVATNGGKLFTRQMFSQAKEGALYRQQMKKENEANKESSSNDFSKRQEELDKSYDEFKGISEMTHRDLLGRIEKLEKNLGKEKALRLKSEEDTKNLIQELEKTIEILRLEAKEITEAARLESRKTDEKIRKLKAELESLQGGVKCSCVIA